MKKILTLLSFLVFCSIADAQEITRAKNTATQIPFEVLNSSTGKKITGACGTAICTTCSYTEGGGCAMAACGGACSESTTTLGDYHWSVLAGEINNDYADYAFSNSAANAVDRLFTVKTKPAAVNVMYVGGFSVISGVAQVSAPSPTGSSFKLDSADVAVYRAGQAVCFSYGSGAPNNECSIITSCAGSSPNTVCQLNPVLSANVAAGVTYFVGSPSMDGFATGVELSGPPAKTATLLDQIQTLFMGARDSLTQDSGSNQWTQQNDAGSTIWTRTVTPGSAFNLGKAH